MSKIGFFQDVFFTTVVFIFTTMVLSEKFSDRATTVVFYYSGFKIPKITLEDIDINSVISCASLCCPLRLRGPVTNLS